MTSTIRTRFAPSPTGYMHVGGVRTALFSWLAARQANGKFVLRIEDTDQARKVEGSTDHILESLGWLGLDHDEGPIYQSERAAQKIYFKWAKRLIDSGRAYSDPYSKEELQAFRDQAKAEKQPFLYRNHRPENPDAWDGSRPLRFKSDPKAQTVNDLVMGELSAGKEAVDDFILIKSDGYPTYNFAHIVDDIEMGITHVIRGQEFVASLPNYVNLYEALEEPIPCFATVPHILGESGSKKLSKRDGAKDILDYREEGYLPEAMINFLATLGWNDGSEQEVFTVAELIEKFDLRRIHKGSAQFDERRLLWLNGAHIRQLYQSDPEKLFRMLGEPPDTTFWPPEAFNEPYDAAYRKKVLALVQERLKFFAELPGLTRFFFKDLPLDPILISDHKQLKKIDRVELADLLKTSLDTLESTDWKTEPLQNSLNQLLEQTQQNPAVLFSLIRIATTQAPASPGLAETLAVLGQKRSLERMNRQLAAI